MSEDGKNSKTGETEKVAGGNPFNPDDIEATQKIEIDQLEIYGDDSEDEVTYSRISRDTEIGTGSVIGKSIFSRKQVADDYVKSNSVLYRIDSVPPLKDKLELQDIDSNYELQEELTDGAQGTIRKAFDKSLKREVVVKSLKIDESEKKTRKNKSHFVSEARIMAQLDHPSIVPLYGLHSSGDERLHLAMKHIHGKTLQKYLEDVIVLYGCEGIENFDEKRSLANRIGYLIKVCEAVDYAHCKGVIHRDLKPDNIMIGNYGEVYVMDWGLACLIYSRNGSRDKYAYRNELVGTPSYIAPEIIKGASCSAQSDIFSLGMILFEIITLQKAVIGRTIKDVLKNIIRGRYRPFKHRFLSGKLPSDLKAIINKAVDPQPLRRYKTAEDLAKDLRLYLMHEETSARPDNTVRKYMRAMLNHKLITFSVILCILLCCAVVTIYSLYSQKNLIQAQKDREDMLTTLQYEAIEHANEMERIFFYFKNQLANVSYNAGLILSREPDSATKIYTYEDFSRASTVPPDYSYSTYYGIKVSLDHAVMKPGPGTRPSGQFNKKIVPLEKMFRHILFTSDPCFSDKNKALLRKTILDTGAPLCWIYLGLKNGTMFSYPGKGAYAEAYDPRKRLWYREALAKERSIIWSEPYQCAVSAKIVIACAKCIFDEKGDFQGVISMDISLDYIQKHLFKKQDVQGFREYLLNPQGRIVLSSDFEYERAKTNG
ncbi:MAG: serine/threonine protein kinase, partial [Victivallaceae bacterium]|nr:serine/threonine protein kinase [Victivallaceae bacterium]